MAGTSYLLRFSHHDRAKVRKVERIQEMHGQKKRAERILDDTRWSQGQSEMYWWQQQQWSILHDTRIPRLYRISRIHDYLITISYLIKN